MMIDGENHKIMGYETKTYMLEKGRLCNDNNEERKFHIFYALVKCLSPEEKAKYRFRSDWREYQYIADTLQLPCLNDDEKTFHAVLQAFEVGLEITDRSSISHPKKRTRSSR
jgi:myosin heavy subunit